MEELKELLVLSEKDPHMFDEYIYSIAETVEDTPYEILRDEPYINKTELVAGYNVSYGYRLAKAKVKDEGEMVYAEVTVFNIFNFLGKPIRDSNLLITVKNTIMDRLKEVNS